MQQFRNAPNTGAHVTCNCHLQDERAPTSGAPEKPPAGGKAYAEDKYHVAMMGGAGLPPQVAQMAPGAGVPPPGSHLAMAGGLSSLYASEATATITTMTRPTWSSFQKCDLMYLTLHGPCCFQLASWQVGNWCELLNWPGAAIVGLHWHVDWPWAAPGAVYLPVWISVGGHPALLDQ